jgi:hypothetical protein
VVQFTRRLKGTIKVSWNFVSSDLPSVKMLTDALLSLGAAQPANGKKCTALNTWMGFIN